MEFFPMMAVKLCSAQVILLAAFTLPKFALRHDWWTVSLGAVGYSAFLLLFWCLHLAGRVAPAPGAAPTTTPQKLKAAILFLMTLILAITQYIHARAVPELAFFFWGIAAAVPVGGIYHLFFTNHHKSN